MARVLIADDEVALLRSYARILTAAGHEVVTASDGKAAAGMLEDASFDVILSDIMMPGLTGIDLLRAVRERDLDVPVIIMTANPALDTAMQALEQGAMRYLQKPIERELLEGTVARAVKLHQLARMKREALDYLKTNSARVGDRAGLETVFIRALRSIYVAVQPVVSVKERKVYGYEALVRCREPAVPNPGALLAAAEKLGSLVDLGRSIRIRAAAVAAELAPGEALFVNLHARDLLDDTLYSPHSELSKVANRVILEMTERASMDEVDDVRERAARLRKLGFRIAVDDLGAGYAGLTSFANLEPEVVKIDMGLVRGVHGEVTKQRLIRTLVGLCKEMGIQIVAEGVERAEERDMLISLGCDLLQGYLFARPDRPFPQVSW